MGARGSLFRPKARTWTQAAHRHAGGGQRLALAVAHLVVDTNGYLLAVQVHPAHSADGPGARGVLTQAKRVVPTVRKLWADRA